MSADSASVLAWREELSALQARLGELFVRAEPRRQAGLYLEGLLSAAKRKNGWQLADQIGVFLAYASDKGHALIDRELYLPEAWCDAPDKRTEAAIPDEVAFATKPALAGRMIGRALDAGLSCAWVLGDEIYGSDRRLRMDLERREPPFVPAIRSNQKPLAVLDKHLGQHAASRLAARLPTRAWRRLSAGAGRQRERPYHWARG